MTNLVDQLLGAGTGGAPELDDDRGARRAATFFAIGLIVVALGGLVFLTFRSDDGPSESGSSRSLTESADIGPLPGTDIGTYVAERGRALDRATGERVAVVSLNGYATEADARAAVGGLDVTALLAAPPGGSPSQVTGPMSEWAEAQVAGSREERDELRKLLPTVDDPQFREFYQAEVARLTQVVDGLRPDGPLVFGVVVRGPAPELQQLARGPQVRLVDVGATAEAPPGTELRGLRPEETTTADEPPTRPF